MSCITNDCSFVNIRPIGCRSCGTTDTDLSARLRRIWNSAGASTSLYMGNLNALSVVGPQSNLPTLQKLTNWNQSSDRLDASIQTSNIPSHGNSTTTTLTRHRPGASAPGGSGVDVKHNSYARFLARKKAGNLNTISVPSITDCSNSWPCSKSN